MRYLNNILFFAFIILAFTACSGPSFNTVNNMRNINGTIYFKDGTEKTGQLTSTLANTFNSNSYIQFAENGKDRRKVAVNEVKAIRVRNDYYEPKLIDQGWGSKDQLLFVKRLTKDGSLMHLYELYEQNTRNTNTGRFNRYGGTTQVVDDFSYYITVPGKGELTAWNIEGRHLTPNFEHKMSDIVKDCPTLAEKIKRKDKGYFYAKISLIAEKRIETMMTIIEEYNQCKQSAASK